MVITYISSQRMANINEPDTYWDIQTDNPNSEETWAKLEEAVKEVHEVVKSRDKCVLSCALLDVLASSLLILAMDSSVTFLQILTLTTSPWSYGSWGKCKPDLARSEDLSLLPV